MVEEDHKRQEGARRRRGQMRWWKARTFREQGQVLKLKTAKELSLDIPPSLRADELSNRNVALRSAEIP